jgi:outer membrane protein TolC
VPKGDGRVLTLVEAVAFALANNPRLEVARAAIGRAQGQQQVAFAPFLPQVALFSRYGATSGNLSPGAPGPTGGIEATSFNTHSFVQSELQVQWTVHDFGRTAGRFRQAVSAERIAELQYTRARETVAFDAALAFSQALLGRSVRTIREEAVRRAEAVLKDTKARRAAGVADRDAVLRAEVQLSEAREAVIVARDEELAAQARLNNALGRDASLPIEVVEPPAPPPLQLSLREYMDTAAVRRPEASVARETTLAAGAGLEAARGGLLPRIYLLGSLGYVDGANVKTGWQEGAGIHINQPLYHGGGRRAEVRAAEATVEETLAAARVVLDAISLQVTLAYRQAETARERIALSRPAVAEAHENLRLVREKYRNGTATPTDIVDAETALTRAQQRHATASYEYLAALARLDYAVGNPQGRLLAAPAAP